MAASRSVAVAQTCPVKGDVQANLAEHLALIRLAAREGGRLVVFPELSLTGYEPELAADLAFSARDARLESLAEASAATSTVLVVGAPVRLGSGLHIGAFIVGPDRAIDLYTKRHLGAFSAGAGEAGTVPPPEDTVFQAGDRDPLIRVKEVTAAIAVCADTGQASHPRRAAERGAGAYLASMFVIPSDFTEDAARLQRFARAHSLVVAMANYGGPTGGLPAAGQSSIWSPSGDLLVRLEATGAGVAAAVESASGWRVSVARLGEQRSPRKPLS